MRFVLAIVAFVVAAAMILLGIAQRTVLLEPASATLSTTLGADDRYAIIESSALLVHDGVQTVTASGASTNFIALGREADVEAWLGDDAFQRVRYDPATKELTEKEPQRGSTTTPEPSSTPTPETTDPAAPPTQSPAPGDAGTDGTAGDAEPGADPAGSDLWLDEFSGKARATATVNVPKGYALIVASDGTKPAPSRVSISWPVDNSTPWAGPLIAGGCLLLVLGLALYLLAIIRMRRSRRPRRNMPRGPRMPRLPRAPRPKTIKQVTSGPGPRSIGRSKRVVAVPVVLIGGLLLSGCSSDFWPAMDQNSTPTPSAMVSPPATAAADSDDTLKPPAVTVPQVERIVRKIAVVAGKADETRDDKLLETRFTGPALALREANYKVRGSLADYAAPDPIPASPVTVTVPQQTDSWPRVVMTVIKSGTDDTAKPTMLVMTQETARSDYLVRYAVALTPDATVPGLAPASVGSPIVAPDSQLLLLPPNQVSNDYADILLKGEASEYYKLFDLSNDPLYAAVGPAYKEKRTADLPATAAITYENTVGSGTTIALATNDSGALVTANINETETVKPTDGGTVSPQNAAKAYSGVENSAKGVIQTFGDQIIFYVPPAGSSDKITLLGFAQGIISASEVQ